jgi:hypothetical protein
LNEPFYAILKKGGRKVNIFQKAMQEQGITYEKLGEPFGLDKSNMFKIVNEQIPMPIWFAVEAGELLGISEEDALQYWCDSVVKRYKAKREKYGTGRQKHKKTHSTNIT